MVMVLVRWWFNDGGDGGEMMVTLNKIIKIKPSNTRGNFQNDWQTWWNDKGSKGEKHIETTQVAVKHSERERERIRKDLQGQENSITRDTPSKTWMKYWISRETSLHNPFGNRNDGKDKERLIQFRSTVTRVVTRRGPASSIEARIWQWREFVAWMDRWHNKRCHLAKVWWQPHSLCVEHQRDLFLDCLSQTFWM